MSRFMPERSGGRGLIVQQRQVTYCGSAARSHCRSVLMASAMGLAVLQLTAPGSARAEPSVGQFELKTLESGPDYLEFQSQNAYAWGQPTRRTARTDDGELAFDENSVTRLRNALEIEKGWTRYFKTRIGIEFEQERFEEPEDLANANSFDEWKLTEVGGEAIAIFIPRNGDGFGLGAVVEVEFPTASEESKAVVMGPILELASGPWLFAAVPMLVHDFGGEGEDGGPVDDKWDFAYAAQLAYTVSDRLTLALEAYGTVHRLGETGFVSEEAALFGDFDQHRIGPIAYISWPLGGRGIEQAGAAGNSGGSDDEEEGSEVTLGIGALAGLNANTPDGTLKLSLEVDF